MRLDRRHYLAAKALAEGGSLRAAGKAAACSASTAQRWQQYPEFIELVRQYESGEKIVIPEVAEILESQAQHYEHFEDARLTEIELTDDLRKVLRKVIDVLAARLSEMSEEEIRELPVRHVSTLLKSFQEGFNTLQISHDRITGWGTILRQLETMYEANPPKK